MSRLRATLYSLLIALASPLAAGSLSLQVTNPTSSPWRIWGSASLHLADEGAPAGLEDPTGLQIPALGTLQVHLAWEDGPGQARPLFHAESVDAADTMGWTMAPDRIPAGAIQWTLRLQAPSPELLLRSVADPIFLPSPPPPPGNTLAALPPQEPGAGSNNRGNAPSPSPQSLPSEPSSSGGEGPAPSGKDSSVKVYATVEFETRGSSRKITLLDADRPPVLTRMPIQAQGTPAAVEEPCRWAKEGRRRYIMVFPGYRYFVKISGNADFGRDPLVAFSRVMVLSGPGGEPWNAASLLGSREGAAGPGDPWRFRLRTPDTLPGFQEEVGGRRNCFVFGEVDAGIVHGVTSLPIPAEDGDTEPQSVSGKRVQPQEDGDGVSQSTRRRKGVLTELTVRNHLGSPCFLRADNVRRMRSRQHLLDLGGNLPPIPVPWVKRTDCPATSRFLEIPAGQAVHLEVDPYSQWGVEKRKRVLHLEVPGGTPGAALLAVQGYHPLNSPAAPWQWFLHDSSGREAALLPGLELVRGSILEIRPLEGQDDAGAVPGESKQPLEDEWEEVVEDSGVAPLAGNGSPQGSGPILLPSPQGSPSESSSSGGEGPAPSGKGSSVKVYATLEFETRGSSRTITLLETVRPPVLTRMPIQAQGTPAAAEKLCHWEREGGRRRIRLVPGYRYFAKVSGNSDFSRDPLISYSRVMVLSGPGGEPWNAASLVGSREGAAGPGDPWRFRLRAPDTLPGFQEEAGGRRNCFVFGEVEAGVVHGVTSLPIPAQDGNTGPQSVSRKRVRPQEDGDEASQSNKRKTGVLTEITVRNHLGSPCFLRADDVRRMGIRQYPMDLGGNPLPLLVDWVKHPARPATSRFLEIPAGQAVHLEVKPDSRWGVAKQQRLLHLEVPGGTTGATLLAVQGYHPLNSPALPWRWVLRDTTGREGALLPGLELVGGSTLEIRPLEGQDDASAVPGESKEPLEDEQKEVVEESGVAPLAGNGSPSESSGGGDRASTPVRRVPGQPYAILEFETRVGSRRITLLDVDRAPKLTRRSIPAQGTPAEPDVPCRWAVEGRRRYLDLVPGYLYTITITANSYFAWDPLVPHSRVLVLSGPDGEPWNAATLMGKSKGDPGSDNAWRFRLRATDALPGFLEEEGGRRNHFAFGAVEAGVVHRVTSLPIQGQDAAVDRQSPSGKRFRTGEVADEVPRPNKRLNSLEARITVRNRLEVPCFLRIEGVTRTPSTGILMDMEDNLVPGKAPWRKQDGHPGTTRFLTIPSGRAVLLQVDQYSRLGFKRGERLIHLLVPGGTTGATLLATRKTGTTTGLLGPWTWSLRQSSGLEATGLPGLELVDGKTLEVRPLEVRNEAKALPGESKDVEDDWWVVEEEESGTLPLAGNDPAQESSSGLMALALAAIASQEAQ